MKCLIFIFLILNLTVIAVTRFVSIVVYCSEFETELYYVTKYQSCLIIDIICLILQYDTMQLNFGKFNEIFKNIYCAIVFAYEIFEDEINDLTMFIQINYFLLDIIEINLRFYTNNYHF